MKARLAGGCGGHVEWSVSTPVSKSPIATLSECSGHRWPRRRGQQWKEQVRNKAIIGFGERCEHAAYPPGARGTAPLVRICPTAGCAITGSDARAAAAAGSARPHGARLRPAEVSRGRSPPPWQATARRAPAVSQILGVGGAGRPRRLDGPGAILANCEGS